MEIESSPVPSKSKASSVCAEFSQESRARIESSHQEPLRRKGAFPTLEQSATTTPAPFLHTTSSQQMNLFSSGTGTEFQGRTYAWSNTGARLSELVKPKLSARVRPVDVLSIIESVILHFWCLELWFSLEVRHIIGSFLRFRFRFSLFGPDGS